MVHASQHHNYSHFSVRHFLAKNLIPILPHALNGIFSFLTMKMKLEGLCCETTDIKRQSKKVLTAPTQTDRLLENLAPDLEQIFLSESVLKQENSQYFFVPPFFAFPQQQLLLKRCYFMSQLCYVFRFLQRFIKNI